MTETPARSRTSRLTAHYPAGTTSTVVLAGLGAVVFTIAGMPAPLLLGPLTATLTAAVAGLRLAYPRWLQIAVLAVIGINVGGSLTTGSLSQAEIWLPSLAGEIAALLGALAVGSLIMRRLAGQSMATAFLASYPGHLIMVLAAATEGRADARTVAIAQSLRLVVLIAAIPLIFHSQAAPAAAPPPPLILSDIMTVIGAGLAGIGAGLLLKFPTPALTGSIFGAGITALLGFSLGPLPQVAGDWLLVIVGGMIGARFAGTPKRALLTSIPMCGLTVAAMLGAVAAIAWPLSIALGLPFGQLLLAYAPGGADVMPLLALTQGHDPVFVGVHHGMRLLVMAVVLPMAARLYAAP